MWELDYKESWALKNWCFWTVVLEKILESPLDWKEIHWVSPKGNQSWMYWKDWCWSWSSNTWATWCEELTYWKEPNAGKDWRQEEMGRTEDEMVGWYHLLSGHEFDQVLGVCDGPGGLVCCSPWGHKESETTEQLNWTGAGVLSNHLALEPWVSTHPCLTVSKQGSLSHEAPDVRPRMNLSASLSASIPWTLAQGCGAQSLQRKEIIHRKHNSPVSWRLFPF